MWSCNFNSQLANALSIEGDYRGSISALEFGYACATEVRYPELQVSSERLQEKTSPLLPSLLFASDSLVYLILTTNR